MIVEFLSRYHHIDRTTDTGKMIDGYLKRGVDLTDQSIHLLYSANRWEKKTIIESSLKEGKTVICDRYAYSGVAFSMAKGMDMEWCKSPDKGLPKPDLLLFLHLSPEAASKRPGYGDERYEENEFQKKVRVSYQQLEDDEKQLSQWTHINSERSMDEVFNDMKEKILHTVENVEGTVGELWK